MYTDDMTVFVRYLDSITHLLNMLEKFQINTSKTDALWLNFGKTDKTQLSISIIHKILFVHQAISFHTKLNFDGKLGNMENVLNTCQCRKLTLIGRINMVKTLVLSKLIFNTSTLYVPPHVIGKTNKLIFNFIWGGKSPKIKKKQKSQWWS